MAGKADKSDIDSIKQISAKLSHYEHLIGEFDKLVNEGYDPAFTILHIKNSRSNFLDYVDKSTWFHADRDKQSEYRKRVWDQANSDASLIKELKQITLNGEFPIPAKHRRHTLLKCVQMEVGMRGEPNADNPFRLITPSNNDRELIEEVHNWDKDSQQWYYLYCGEEKKTQLYYMTLDAFDLVCKGWSLFAPLFESQSEEFKNVKKYGLSTWLQLLIFASIQGKLNTHRRPQTIALDERLEQKRNSYEIPFTPAYNDIPEGGWCLHMYGFCRQSAELLRYLIQVIKELPELKVYELPAKAKEVRLRMNWILNYLRVRGNTSGGTMFEEYCNDSSETIEKKSFVESCTKLSKEGFVTPNGDGRASVYCLTDKARSYLKQEQEKE